MRVSVVIPTFNAGPGIAALLQSLQAQQPSPPDEIIAIDSGSRDGTCQRVLEAGGRVIELQEPFNHGRTRDAACAAASGEIVVLTVQDAVLASPDYLARVVEHFCDPAVAGVTTRQIPPPDGPLELRIKAEIEAQEAREPVRVSLAAHPNYSAYTPAQRLELCRFDDVCAAIRRSVWAAIPYGTCRYAEDYQWARKVLEAGHTIVREPRVQVIHAHRRPFGYEFRRAILDAWVLDDAFGYRYRLRDKLNRVKKVGRSEASAGLRPTLVSRCSACKTYAAHILGRWAYGGLRALKMRNTLERLTRGI